MFSSFMIKTPRALAALAPLDILIVKTLTNLLYYMPGVLVLLNYSILFRHWSVYRT